MKLAVSTYSLSRWRSSEGKSLEQCLAWIADAGVKGVEVAGLDEKAGSVGPVKRAGQLRRRADRLGLKIVSYCEGAELLMAPKAQRTAIERVKLAVDVAAELGAPSMRHDVTRGWAGVKGVPGPETFANALNVIVPAIREITEYAKTKKVITSVENHGFYMQASRRIEQLIKKVADPNFALTIDMGNFLCVNEDPVQAVRRLTKYVIMAHVKDFHVKPKRQAPPTGWFATPTAIALRGAIVGHGQIDVPAQLKLLKKAGYKGYLSLEFEGMEPPTTAITLGLDYLRQELRKLGGRSG